MAVMSVSTRHARNAKLAGISAFALARPARIEDHHPHPNQAARIIVTTPPSRLLLLLAALLPPAAARAQEPPDPALVQHGQRVFLYCSACHNLQPGQSAKVGPVLSGVVGAHAAARPDYDYSQALKQSGLVWTEENLEKWLTKPGELVPGTKMAFIGLSKPEDRAAVIAYLQTTAH